jgi:hypothetical protein
MERISIVGVLMMLSACSTHAMKCHGRLRPINEPTVNAPHSPAGSQPATSSQSKGGQKRTGSADPFRTEPQR